MPTLADEFQPLFDQIAEGAARRERDRALPYAEMAQLAASGFTALRVPVEYGGRGVGLREFFELFISLAAADSNLAQALRSHLSIVEQHVASPHGALSEWLLREAGTGKLIGNGETEAGAGFDGRYRTQITTGEDGVERITGEKAYCTGTLFADYIIIAASRVDDPWLYAVVDANDPGVERRDDWNGFGQRLTASGTTALDAVPLAHPGVMPLVLDRPTPFAAQLQLVLLSCLAGIAEAAQREAVAYVQGRRRNFSHGLTDLPIDDPLVQAVVGRVASAAFAARHTVLAAVDELDRSFRATRAEAEGHLSREDSDRAIEAAELATQRAQIAVSDLVLDATTRLFEVGGASSVDAERALDRFWRNARTISAHNPIVFKERSVGDALLRGSAPVYGWATSERGAATSAATPTA